MGHNSPGSLQPSLALDESVVSSISSREFLILIRHLDSLPLVSPHVRILPPERVSPTLKHEFVELMRLPL